MKIFINVVSHLILLGLLNKGGWGGDVAHVG
jgi:hypothetical protein